MVLLYGSLTGLGLKNLFHHKLTPWQLIPVVSLFLLFFVILIKYIDIIRTKLNFILLPIRKVVNTIFGIKES